MVITKVGSGSLIIYLATSVPARDIDFQCLQADSQEVRDVTLSSKTTALSRGKIRLDKDLFGIAERNTYTIRLPSPKNESKRFSVCCSVYHMLGLDLGGQMR